MNRQWSFASLRWRGQLVLAFLLLSLLPALTLGYFLLSYFVPQVVTFELVAVLLCFNLVLSVTGFVLLLTVVRNFYRLRDYLESIAEGGIPEVPELIGGSDTSRIQHSMESIVKQLARDRARLSRLNDTLELQVAERTTELELANDRLLKELLHRRELEQQEGELRDRLARSQRMESLGLLAGGIAHDLNNVLGPIVALPEVIGDELALLKGLPDDTRRLLEGDLDLIRQSALRASQVIRDLLTMSRRGRYERCETDLGAVVRGFVESADFKTLRRRHEGITLGVAVDDGLPAVLGSEPHLFRVLHNLVQNAFESVQSARAAHPLSMDGDSQDPTEDIEIAVSQERLTQPVIGHELIPIGDYVVISVRDRGIGISYADSERIFEPFFSRKSAGEHSGSGLGLSVVHGVVKDHEGYVNVQSRLGAGTGFDLYFPAYTGEGARRALPDIPQGRNERVLIVDDEPGQRYLASRMLEHLGYRTASAATFDESLRMHELGRSGDYGGNPFDVILLDLLIDGDETADDLLVRVKAFAPVPVIVVSGFLDDKILSVLRDRSISCIGKPFDVAQLANTVRDAVGAAGR